MLLEHCELSDDEIFGEEDWNEPYRRSIDNEIEEIESKIENKQIDLKNETNEDKRYELECDIEDLHHNIEWLRKMRRDYE
jgi:hypothetical protein